MDVNTSEPKNNDTCFGNVKEVRFDQAKVAQLKGDSSEDTVQIVPFAGCL